MKAFASLFLIGLLSAAQQVAAHNDHHHGPMTEQSAVTVAKNLAAKLSVKDGGLGFGKLPASWSKVSAKDVKLHKKGDGYYIVAVNNEAEKKVLYVLMSSEGEAYDANFSGEFKNIK